MTVFSEVKRTLVKSRPELWVELSDPKSLGGHLGDPPGIKITRIEQETTVEWEADQASGSVQLQSSGFGTKVTLSLSRELPAIETASIHLAPEPAPQPVSEPAAREEAVEAVLGFEVETAVNPQPIVKPEPIAIYEPPRRGFFTRLFKRRHTPAPLVIEPAPDACVEPNPDACAEPGPAGLTEPEPMPTGKPSAKPEAAKDAVEPQIEAERVGPDKVEQAADPVERQLASVAVDLTALEAQMAEQDQAMLTAMLDRLGAAHHRPFSRS